MPSTYKPRDRETVSQIMRRVRSTDTKPEVILRKALWRAGLRYRKHVKRLPGSPDMVFAGAKVVVFVDGEFWHGRQWQSRGLDSLSKQFAEPKAVYWVPKITRNMDRDKRVNEELKTAGWKVVRIWESDIRTNLASCVQQVLNAAKGTN